MSLLRGYRYSSSLNIQNLCGRVGGCYTGSICCVHSTERWKELVKNAHLFSKLEEKPRS